MYHALDRVNTSDISFFSFFPDWQQLISSPLLETFKAAQRFSEK
jgi:hypothetical protein